MIRFTRGLQCGQYVFRLTQSWWQTDRIRAASSEGRLLRLHPGAFVCVNDRRAEIVGRTVGQAANEAWVLYDLKLENAPATLTVRLDRNSQKTGIEWSEDGETTELFESEITVFA